MEIHGKPVQTSSFVADIPVCYVNRIHQNLVSGCHGNAFYLAITLTCPPGFFINPRMLAFQRCMAEIVRQNGTSDPHWFIDKA